MDVHYQRCILVTFAYMKGWTCGRTVDDVMAFMAGFRDEGKILVRIAGFKNPIGDPHKLVLRYLVLE